MHNLELLEASFHKYYDNILKWPRESLIQVDLELLQQLGLLHYHNQEQHDPNLTRYFHVIETHEKITLINDEFVVWIVPEKVDDISSTYTLIALNKEEGPQLELTFVTAGVYNTSKLVLRVLEKLLFDIQENEDFLTKIKK